ncbi:PCI-domain-containing protein [Fistulina hepatica ATCC 64428]|uniref:PCI-domain-containing protein n=1 Tax=Fistulina hepatica ATCC 64428 TaxID=1128425 RepID=A0A0D6ZYT5_9AGAR|nr:PCI-domain-containing protein [Fistulina hepatica ATCC 64428]
MEVEIPPVEEAIGAPASFYPGHRRSSPIIVIDDAHPFDLEAYISNYTGQTAIDRLLHLIHVAPSIAPYAFRMVIERIQKSRNPSLLQQAISIYEQTASSSSELLPSANDLVTLDTRWADETLARNQADRTRLEVELKTYTNNMIKESIRMAHRDLADFYRSTGESALSIKHYTKSREFCVNSNHVLEMCLSVLELLIEQRNYAHVTTYVFKAEAALDAAAVTANASAEKSAASSGVGNSAAFAATMKKSLNSERERVQSKLNLATGIAHLGQGYFEKAALAFLRIGSIKDLGDWVGKLVAPGDIAVYGVLCALSSYSRSALKAQILENAAFGVYMEQEPYVRELLEAYMGSTFKTVLELLDRHAARHYADMHLYPHVDALQNAIRSWAVKLYFQPFQSIRLDRMSAAFGWTVGETERHVVTLIQSGEIQARVDSRNKVLLAKKTDPRTELFERAIRAGDAIEEANRKLLFRMRVQQADLTIKAPKGQQQHLPRLNPDFFENE